MMISDKAAVDFRADFTAPRLFGARVIPIFVPDVLQCAY